MENTSTVVDHRIPARGSAVRGLDVSLHVKSEVVRAGEAAVTLPTLEGLHPRVFPVVAGQLVGPGEVPAATVPLALVRLLTCNKAALVST